MTELSSPAPSAAEAGGDTDALSGLGRRSALGLAGAAVSGVATIGTILVANRSLDKVALGEFFVAITVFSIAQGLCSLGIDAGLQYWVPSLRAKAAKHLLGRSFVTVGVMGLVAAGMVFALAAPFARLVADKDAGDASGILRAVAIMMPFAGLYEVAFGALRACDRILPSVVLDRFLRPVAQVAAMGVVAVLDGGALAMTYAYTVPIIVSVVAAIVVVGQSRSYRKLPGTREHLPSSEFWRYTLPRAVARIAQVLTQRLDVLLLASLGTVEDAGVYGTVSRCMIAGVFVATAVQQMVQPRLRRLIVRGDNDSVRAMYGASTTWLVLATWPAYLSMAIFSPLVLRAFGHGAVRGQHALMMLCLTMLVASACGLVDVVLLMLGRSWLSTFNVLGALALNFVLNLLLISSLGMNGSAIAWCVAILATNIVPLYQVSRSGLHPGGPPLTTAMATGLVAFGLPMLIARLVGGATLPTFAIAFSGSLIAYVVTVWRFRRRVLLDRFFGDLVRKRPVNAAAT